MRQTKSNKHQVLVNLTVNGQGVARWKLGDSIPSVARNYVDESKIGSGAFANKHYFRNGHCSLSLYHS
ncbi:hypothetical protein [Neptuniibacter sp. QD37_11]|uniref:hypothetical protein n=1 Tax=Neptuniibacter sp. QD37_11 TaxID=3398209 RepID=UPI0039F56B5A